MLSHAPLISRHVRLEPLTRGHLTALVAAASEARDSYQWTWVPSGPEQMSTYLEQALAACAEGRALPFATVDLRSARVVGTTRFAGIEYWDYSPRARPERPGPDAVEIGWTWLAASAQRTHVNTEAKLLMLSHAFEVWRVERVYLKTDARNERSRRAIERIFATFEGILRRHAPALDGGVRDSALYSIVADDWPDVRERLKARCR